MTELLKKAITAIEALPDDVQDAIAARLLAEAEDEAEWARRFEQTTAVQWNRLAEAVRESIAREPTEPLEEVFPPHTS